MEPTVSVIVTTRNEEKNIGFCLESVLKQSYPQNSIEIILIDNNSVDKTKEIAAKYTDKIFNHGPERSAQRNLGVEKSAGGYFIYLDADMTLEKDVIRSCVERMQNNPGIIALYISEIVTGKNFFSQVRRFERSFYDGSVIDAVRFIKKDAFFKTGGFDESLTGPEDWDLDKRLRQLGPVDLISIPIYHNETEFRLRKYLSKKSYYAPKLDNYIKKWGKNDPDIRRQLGIYYRFLGVFMEKGKWKKMVRHPMLTLGLFFLRFSVGIKYLINK